MVPVGGCGWLVTPVHIKVAMLSWCQWVVDKHRDLEQHADVESIGGFHPGFVVAEFQQGAECICVEWWLSRKTSFYRSLCDFQQGCSGPQRQCSFFMSKKQERDGVEEAVTIW